ncbi:MAG TPA: hypothetical protein VLA02_01825 [Reyranella sp.]|nr:hypothetical protein [Reyranella sp.]
MRRTTLAARLALVCSLAGLGGCEPPPASPERDAYCTRLYNLYQRYHTIVTFAHDGDRARADLAIHDCAYGRYDAGEAELKKLLAREGHKVPVYTPSR